MQLAMLKSWESYSDDELRLLLRFALHGYETMLAATNELKTMIAKQPAKGQSAKKPRAKS
jgi:hypothetical protein